MKVYRFMSLEEFTKLINGNILTNDRKHNSECSTAVGFSFGIGNYEQAVKDFRHLRGAIWPKVLIVADIADYMLENAKGRYINYDKYDKGKLEFIWLDEKCLTSYNIKCLYNLEVYSIDNPLTNNFTCILK